MKIILTARVSNLGQIGDVVEVKNGYAKNFLIPNKKAICFTANNQKIFEAKKAEFEKANENNLSTANSIKGKIVGKNIIIIENASDDGRLYGSVSSSVIAAKINEFLGEKIVEKTNVSLAKPIKEIGIYLAKVDLHSDSVFDVKLVISRSESEVEALLKADEKNKRDAAKKSKDTEEKSESTEETSADQTSEEKPAKKERKPRKKKEEV